MISSFDPDSIVPLIRGWNRFGLPLLLLATAVWLLRRKDRAWASRRRTVQALGWLHLAIAAWSAQVVAAEAWAYRTMGVFPSNPVTGFLGSLLTLVFSVPIGVGLIGLRRWARGFGVVVDALRSLRIGLAAYLLVRHGALIDFIEWPSYVAGWAATPFALLVLLLPSTGRAVRGESDPSAVVGPPDILIALAARLLTIVAASAAAVDAVDWLVRTVLFP